MSNTKDTKKNVEKIDVYYPSPDDLIKSGFHFGHHKKRKHPSMDRYIHSINNKVHLIDLYKTEEKFKEAIDFVYSVSAKGENVVFLGTKDQAKDIIKTVAEETKSYYVIERWIGGILTNFDYVKKSRDRLVALREGLKSGHFDSYTKKERVLLQREVDKLTAKFGGLVGMSKKPAAIIMIDGKRDKTSIKECNATGVKVICLADTNINTEGIDYIIPGNDDAFKSLNLYLTSFKDAISKGKESFYKKNK